MSPEDVLQYWFGDWDDARPLADDDPNVQRWWGESEDLDADIAQRFGELHAAVVRGEHADWAATARGALALVIVVDQLSRALYRGTARAYRWDDLARRTTLRVLEGAGDRELKPIERVFLYLPLMHAEDRATHRRALALFADLAEEAEEAGIVRADYYRQLVAWEIRLKAVIDRFGRDPERNFALERTSTPEELAFLTDSETTE